MEDRSELGDFLQDSVLEMVNIESVSGNEKKMADYVEGLLSAKQGLEIERIGDNVLCWRKGEEGLPLVVLAGHLDTVPPNGNETARVEDGYIHGIGACDMKGGVAVMLALALCDEVFKYGLCFVFYVCEEVEATRNGLKVVLSQHPELQEASSALILEPSNSMAELGCQGTMRLRLTLGGIRAHSARPWTGVNAITRASELITVLANFDLRSPEIDGVSFRESLSVVKIDAGVANNVIPDRATIWLNYRFAPDLYVSEAMAKLIDYLEPHLDQSLGDVFVIEDEAPGAMPHMSNELISKLANKRGFTAKLGWTDVSFFSSLGIPSSNFGPGDPLLAHSPLEKVRISELESAYATLSWALS